MGEYAIRSDGEEVKIGTCEDMYYLRAEQRHQVRHVVGNVNLSSPEALACRFRFPWPDEDGTQPGEFEDYGRTVVIPGATAPEGVEHYTVQFSAPAGYLVSLPCPEGPSEHGFTIHRNAFVGAVQLRQQKLLADGRLVPVCRCTGCGSMWRVEGQADIEALAVAVRTEGDKRAARNEGDPNWWHFVADRILLGALLVEAV